MPAEGIRKCPECHRLKYEPGYHDAGFRKGELWCIDCTDKEAEKQEKKAAKEEKRIAPRVCRMCGLVKPITDFYVAGSYCKDCMKLLSQEQTLKRNGITREEYLSLSDHQDGKCAACGLGETSLAKNGGAKLLTPFPSDDNAFLICNRCFLRLKPFRYDFKWLVEVVKNLK